MKISNCRKNFIMMIDSLFIVHKYIGNDIFCAFVTCVNLESTGRLELRLDS